MAWGAPMARRGASAAARACRSTKVSAPDAAAAHGASAAGVAPRRRFRRIRTRMVVIPQMGSGSRKKMARWDLRGDGHSHPPPIQTQTRGEANLGLGRIGDRWNSATTPRRVHRGTTGQIGCGRFSVDVQPMLMTDGTVRGIPTLHHPVHGTERAVGVPRGPRGRAWVRGSRRSRRSARASASIGGDRPQGRRGGGEGGRGGRHCVHTIYVLEGSNLGLKNRWVSDS